MDFVLAFPDMSFVLAFPDISLYLPSQTFSPDQCTGAPPDAATHRREAKV